MRPTLPKWQRQICCPKIFPALNEAVWIKCGHHFPFAILQGPFRFSRDINYKQRLSVAPKLIFTANSRFFSFLKLRWCLYITKYLALLTFHQLSLNMPVSFLPSKEWTSVKYWPRCNSSLWESDEIGDLHLIQCSVGLRLNQTCKKATKLSLCSNYKAFLY